MIRDILNKSKEQKKILGIWMYDDDDGFWSGYVKDFNEELVFIQHFTKYGKPDGVIVERIENIESIDFDDDYSRLMEYVIQNSDKLDIEPEVKFEITESENWQFELLDKQLGGKDRIVRIQVNANNYCGLVEWVNMQHREGG